MKATGESNLPAIELPKSGTYMARCYSIVDYGTINKKFIKDNDQWMRRIQITFEIPECLAQFSENSEPEPFVVGEELTLSVNKNSNLAKLINQWRGTPISAQEEKEFEVAQMLGKYGLVSIMIQRKKEFANQNIEVPTNQNSYIKFNGIMQPPQGYQEPKNYNELFIFDWDKEFDWENFVRVPKWMQKKIMGSKEFSALAKARGWNEESFNKEKDNTIIRMHNENKWLPGYARRRVEELTGDTTQKQQSANTTQPQQTQSWGNQQSPQTQQGWGQPASEPQQNTQQEQKGSEENLDGGSWLQ